MPATRAVRDDVLRPLSLDMITTVLDRMEARYFVDGTDTVGGIWESGYFYFFVLSDEENDPVFQVNGLWERVLPGTMYAQAALFVNEWNAERTWPKAYARFLEEDEREVGIYGEVTVDFGPSVTLEQLDRALNIGIEAALTLFDEVELTFPEATKLPA